MPSPRRNGTAMSLHAIKGTGDALARASIDMGEIVHLAQAMAVEPDQDVRIMQLDMVLEAACRVADQMVEASGHLQAMIPKIADSD